MVTLLQCLRRSCGKVHTTGAMLQTLEGHSLSVSSVAFSPDDKFLASASCDNTVKLWDSATGVAFQTFKFDVPIGTLSFCNSGQYLKTDRGLLSLQPLGASLSFPDVSLSLSVIDDWVMRTGNVFFGFPLIIEPLVLLSGTT